jgi:hypothetical protein
MAFYTADAIANELSPFDDWTLSLPRKGEGYYNIPRYMIYHAL